MTGNKVIIIVIPHSPEKAEFLKKVRKVVMSPFQELTESMSPILKTILNMNLMHLKMYPL